MRKADHFQSALVIPLGFEPRTLPIKIGMLYQLNYGWSCSEIG